MVTRAPKVAGMPRSTCMTTLSWTFESRPTTMESKSPRSTAPCQTLAPSSTVTSPTSTALGATWIIVSLKVHEDVLHVRVEEDRVDPLFQAQAGLLPPEEGRLRERDGIFVDRHHAGLQALRYRMGLRDVLGPDARGQPIGCVIGPDDRLVEIGEPEGRQDGTEHFLPSHAGLERRVIEDRGTQEVPVLQVRGLRAVAAREHLRSPRYTVVDRLRHVRRMVPRHEGPHLYVLLQSGAEAEFLGLVLQFREERGRDVLMQE